MRAERILHEEETWMKMTERKTREENYSVTGGDAEEKGKGRELPEKN